MSSVSSLAYLNGNYVDIKDAVIPVMDRGFLFGDGVYEVIPVYQGKLFRWQEHIQRLNASLKAIQLTISPSIDWQTILETLVTRNGNGNQVIYLQVTRGPMEIRNHSFPKNPSPTIFARSTPFTPATLDTLRQGGKVITHADIRWKNCHIKSISLLANVLLYQHALDKGVDEVLLFNNQNHVVEGSTSNVFIVKNNQLITPPKNAEILSGITRDFILELVRQEKISYEERIISLDELMQADEVWITSSSREIKPIIEVDGKLIANGKPGAVWEKMILAYKRAIDL